MSVTTFVGPFPRNDLITRVKGANLFKIVGSSASLAVALATPPNVVPAVYFCINETFSKNAGLTGVLIQNATVNIQCVIWIKNYSGTQAGEAAAADMDALLPQLRLRLLNWAPAPAFRPLRMTASRDEFYKDGYLVVQELYRSEYRLQVTA